MKHWPCSNRFVCFRFRTANSGNSLSLNASRRQWLSGKWLFSIVNAWPAWRQTKMCFWRNWRQSARHCIWSVWLHVVCTIRCALILEGEFWEEIFHFMQLKLEFTSDHKANCIRKKRVLASVCFMKFILLLPPHTDRCEREHDRCCLTVDRTLLTLHHSMLRLQGRWLYSRWICRFICQYVFGL